MVLMGVALALKLMPFRRMVHWGSFLHGELPSGKQSSLPARHPGSPGQIGHAVQRAARHLPFNLQCLPQALAAQWMLRRRGIASTLHFGMAKDPGGERAMLAHAWLTVSGLGVVGIAASRGFTEVARFSRETADSAPQ